MLLKDFTDIASITFGYTELIYSDVSMNIVSQLLGRNSISINEESYGKVVKKKVSEQMSRWKGVL